VPVCLILEGDQGTSGLVEILVGAGWEGKLAVANGEDDVLVLEGGIVGSFTLFPRAKEVEESKPRHIDGGELFIGGVGVDQGLGVEQELDGQWLDSVLRQVIGGHAFGKVSEANVNLFVGVEARVRGP
jgi:hypothetical protein